MEDVTVVRPILGQTRSSGYTQRVYRVALGGRWRGVSTENLAIQRHGTRLALVARGWRKSH